jgi:hypothetical protein
MCICEPLLLHKSIFVVDLHASELYGRGSRTIAQSVVYLIHKTFRKLSLQLFSDDYLSVYRQSFIYFLIVFRLKVTFWTQTRSF